jgi:hypothetical protein
LTSLFIELIDRIVSSMACLQQLANRLSGNVFCYQTHKFGPLFFRKRTSREEVHHSLANETDNIVAPDAAGKGFPSKFRYERRAS